MMKMNILHVFDFFSQTYGGGTVNLLYHLARGQIELGHRVSLYTSNYKIDRPYIASLPAVNIVALPSRLDLAGLHVAPSLVPLVKRNLQGFDIIHLKYYSEICFL